MGLFGLFGETRAKRERYEELTPIVDAMDDANLPEEGTPEWEQCREVIHEKVELFYDLEDEKPWWKKLL